MKRLIVIVLTLGILFTLCACERAGENEQNVLYGKYFCYEVDYGDGSGSPDGEWIDLRPTGEGTLCISFDVEMKWKLEGEKLTVEALGGPYNGTLEDHILTLDWGGTMMYFAPQGLEPISDSTEPSTVPYSEPTELPMMKYSDAYVIDAVFETLEYEEYSMEYHIPMIVFEKDGINDLNDMLYEELYEKVYMEHVVGSMEEYDMPATSGITYQWAVSDQFMSVVVSIIPYASSGIEYRVYNVDLSSGELVSESELLEHFGYTDESFYERARPIMGSVLYEGMKDFFALYGDDSEMMNEFDRILANTISDEYVHQSRPFIGENGGLWMISPIGSMAGADYYDQMIDFENYAISEDYLNYTPN